MADKESKVKFYNDLECPILGIGTWKVNKLFTNYALVLKSSVANSPLRIDSFYVVL